MVAVLSGAKKTVPFSTFNEDVLSEVKNSGAAYLVDSDGEEYVLMSKEEYNDRINEAVLIGVADERLSHFDPSKLIPAEEFYKEFGITQEEIDAMPEVELE